MTVGMSDTAILNRLAPFHMDRVFSVFDRFFGRRFSGSAGGYAQDVGVGVLRLGSDLRVKDAAGLLACLNDGRARRVAEQHACGAVLPVHIPRQHLRRRHQNCLMHPGADKTVRHMKPVRETAACRGDVDGGRLMLNAETARDEAGGGRKQHIRRDGGAYDQVNLVRLDAGGVDGSLGGDSAEVGAGDIRFGDAPLPYADARSDPLVGRVDHLL